MVTIQIQPSCPKSFILNDKHLYPNSTNTITQEEYNAIEPYWKQHVTILSRNDISNNINSINGININTNVDICNVVNNGDVNNRVSEPDNSKVHEDVSLVEILEIDQHRIDLVDLINKKPKASTKKT
jgi:hypothetical protein